MPVKSRFAVIVMVLGVWFGFLTILPYVTHVFHPASAGLTFIRDKDWGNYYSRFERALDDHPEEAANAITQIGSGIKGLQTAGIEQFAGTLLAWTGLPAPPLAVILTAILTPLLFVLFFYLFKEIGFDERWSLGLDAAIFVAMFGPLTRMPHPGWSFIPAVGALIAFLRFAKHPSFNGALLTGLLLGILPFLYFWHWTFVWAACGSIALLTFGLERDMRFVLRRPWMTALLALVTLLVATPFIVQTASLMANPLYPEVAVRASFLYQRFPESWPRTILLLIQLAAFASLWRTRRSDRSYVAALGILLGLVLAMHQNVLHNKVLMFASHFEPQMIIASAVAGAWVLTRNVDVVRRGIVVGIAILFLVAGAWDYAFMNGFFVPQPRDFQDQHLLTPIAVLREAPPSTVLTDRTTGRTLTAWTHQGIVYTQHVRFLFVSDETMAERYCVTEMFAPVVDPYRSLYIEYNRVLDSPAMREHEKALVEEACARVKDDPEAFLAQYGVEYVLWNKNERPDWVVPKAPYLKERASGSGWTLWLVAR